MGIWPFRRSRADEDAERLLAAVVQISRQPEFYGDGRAPDTLQGRLELMTLHAVLAFGRLKADRGLDPLAQAFADQLFRHFDAGLREDGVGDLTVPKRMRKIASEFYGRLEAYAAALAASDQSGLASALERNIGIPTAYAAALASYAAATAKAQAEAGPDALMRLDGWGQAPA
jgi:cytochrome b pre-mRNA-processing protein 3